MANTGAPPVWSEMYNMSSPMIFKAGSWQCPKTPSLLGWYSSMLPEMLQECFPFVAVEFVAPPDKIYFHFNCPSQQELHDFVCLHGAGCLPCPNDFTLQGLTNYIYNSVITKIRIGAPKDKPPQIPCGFSALQIGKQSCIHGALTSDMNKCIYVSTKSLDPVWSPRCHKCLGKSNPIVLSNVFRMPATNKRGTRHIYVMKHLESAMEKALRLVFNPSRGIHAYNLQKGTSRTYLLGHVDQAMAECKTIEERRAWMPMNRNASHTRIKDTDGLLEKVEAAFYDVEDQRKPTDIMITIEPGLYKNNTELKALVDARLKGHAGYKLVNKFNRTFVVPIDLWNLSIRIKKGISRLEKKRCSIQFEARLGTQSDLQRRAYNLITQAANDTCEFFHNYVSWKR